MDMLVLEIAKRRLFEVRSWAERKKTDRRNVAENG